MAMSEIGRPSQILWDSPRARRLARGCLKERWACSLAPERCSDNAPRIYAGFLVGFRQAFLTACELARDLGLEEVSRKLSLSQERFRAAFVNQCPDDDLAGFAKASEQAVAADDGSSTPHAKLAKLLAALAATGRLLEGIIKAIAATENEGEDLASWAGKFHEIVSGVEEAFDLSTSEGFATLDRAAVCATAAVLQEHYCKALEQHLAAFAGLHGGGGTAPPHLEALRSTPVVPPRVLIIAGSDSGGGAGIQADIKSCAALGAFSTTAIAALTAQNSVGVQGVFPIPLDFVRQQMRSVLDDLGTDVIKTGMLGTADTVALVGEELQMGASTLEQWRRQIVVDPVMVSTSGHVLLPEDAVESVRRKLCPIATIITPNLHEARLLLGGRDITTIDEMRQAAIDLCAMGPKWALVKGGHLQEVQGSEGARGSGGDDAVASDVLCQGATGECEVFTSKLVKTSHTHGTGCTLASSIAAFLAQGYSVPEAVKTAKDYVSGAISASAHLELGGGPQGAMNHAWRTSEW